MAARHHDTGGTPDDGDQPERDLAERWAEIVAELSDLDTGPGAARDARAGGGDLDEGEPGAGGSGEPGRSPEVDAPRKDPGGTASFPVAPWVSAPPERAARELTGRDWEGTEQIDAAEAEMDEREHFVPPDPGPVLGGDPLLTMAWFGAAGVPIALLLMVVAWRDAPTGLVQGAAVVFAISCMVLVWRLPHRREESDDDPGAVV